MPASHYLSSSQILDMLSQTPIQGKRQLEPLKAQAAQMGFPMNILEDHEVDNAAELHKHEDDLWFCFEGEATFVCGGELMDGKAKVRKDGTIDDNEWKGRIEGGTEYVLKPGDWLWIPAGEPHQHACKGTARLAIIKIPTKKA